MIYKKNTYDNQNYKRKNYKNIVNITDKKECPNSTTNLRTS